MRPSPLLLLLLSLGGCAPIADLGGAIAAQLDPGPLRLADPIGPTTRARVLALDRDPAACRAWLTAEGVSFTPAPDQREGEFCSLEGAVRVGDDLGGARLRLSPARPVTRCGVAVALAVWRRHALEPAAREILGSPVSGIDHLGSYSCRRVNNAETGRVSGHARAAAIDIAGVRLADGRRIGVAADWTAGDKEARFLRRVRDDACRVFSGTLSPDYNAAHRDHLHLEVGGYGLCR